MPSLFQAVFLSAVTLALVAGCAGPPKQGAPGADEAGPAPQEKRGDTAGAAGEGEARTDQQGPSARGLQQQGPAETEALGGGSPAEEQAMTEPPEERRVFFEFDSARVSTEGRDLLRRHAAYAQDHPDIGIVLEGHTDERGSREYNLALGERRAKAAARILTVQGVAKSRIEVVSFGEEQPLVDESNPEAWAKNRRARIRYEERDGGTD